MGFRYLDIMAHKCRLKLHFRLCSEIPKNGWSPKRGGAIGIEIRYGGGSLLGSLVRLFDHSEVPNSLSSHECKSNTRSTSDNRCILHSSALSIRCGHSPDCVRKEKEGPRPSCLNRGDAGSSYLMRDDPRPSRFKHCHMHSDGDKRFFHGQVISRWRGKETYLRKLWLALKWI